MMESVNLDMDDLFDLEADALGGDDYGSMTAPMPDQETDEVPLSEEQANPEEGDADVLSKLKDIKKGAAKKRVLKPQPKLDPTRLTGERGLPALLTLFKNVKFKGKGHEAEDLKLMMSKLEHWGHRLFPKMPFDELIERVEKLGGKGEVKTCVKRIRLDMPLLNADHVEEPEVMDNLPEPEVEFDAEAAYDEMIRQEREMLEREKADNMSYQPEPTRPHTEPTTPVRKETPPATSTPVVQTLVREEKKDSSKEQPVVASEPRTSQGLTPEQKKRLEMNKLNALKKKAARLGVPLESLLPPKPVEDTSSGGGASQTQQNSENSSQQQQTNNGTESSGNSTSEKVENSKGAEERDIIPEQTVTSSTKQRIENNGESSGKSAENQGDNDNDMQTEDQILSVLNEDFTDGPNSKDKKDDKKSQQNSDNQSDAEDEKMDTSSLFVDEDRHNVSKPLLKMCAEPVLDSCMTEKVAEGGSVSESGEKRASASSCGDGSRKGSAGEDLVLEFSDDTNTTHEEETLQSP